MLMVLSSGFILLFNPSNAEAACFRPKHKDAKILETCHVGIHHIALAKYSQMNIPVMCQGFRFFASFFIGQTSHQQYKG